MKSLEIVDMYGDTQKIDLPDSDADVAIIGTKNGLPRDIPESERKTIASKLGRKLRRWIDPATLVMLTIRDKGWRGRLHYSDIVTTEENAQYLFNIIQKHRPTNP